MKNQLLMVVNNILAVVNRYISHGYERNNRRELAECYMSLAMLHDNFKHDSIGQSSLEYVLNKIANRICYIEFFQYYNCFYYLPNNVYDKDAGELSLNIASANINIACFRCNIHASKLFGFSLHSSEDCYFFERGERIFKAVSNFIKYPFDFNVEPFLYLVLNYYQAVKDYSVCGQTTYSELARKRESDAQSLFSKLKSVPIVLQAFRNNPSLKMFWNTTVPESFVVDSSEFALPHLLNIKELWYTLSFYEVDSAVTDKCFKERFADFIALSNNTIEMSLIARLICKSLNYTGDSDFTEQSKRISHYDWEEWNYTNIGRFFAHYEDIRNVECSQEDVSKLYAMNDGELRGRVAACMQNIDGNILDRQSKKAHGVWEISDLETEYIQNGELYHLCMPFKSGLEISGSTVGENYFYQVVKPFTYFGTHCVVVFVTAKKCSQVFENSVQRMRSQCPKWQIEIIQEEQLCKLLKLNGQL